MTPNDPAGTERRRLRLSVIGGSQAGQHLRELAREVGRLIGERGHVLVCGGHGGVMEAACQGAKEAGGLTVGIIRTTNPHDANRFVDIPIVTGMYDARNIIVALSGEAIIVIGGALGTLSEIAFARLHQRAVIGLDPLATIPGLGVELLGVQVARTPREAVDLAEGHAIKG
ncbi:MAG: TIGR00725 family protein [Planctomycetota bacterium]